MVTYRYLGSATTDANGRSKYNFTGSGAGEIDFIASLDNPITGSSIVSEPYSLLDAIFFDGATTDNSSRYYVNTTHTSIAFSTDHYELTFGADARYLDLRNIVDSVKGKTVNVEVDLELPTGASAYVRTQNLSPNPQGTAVTGNATAKLENVVVPADNTNCYFRITFTASSGDVAKFKNFRIYPV